ncbi:hypothetical protein ACVFYP_13805 [Roseomonas sp. F4]
MQNGRLAILHIGGEKTGSTTLQTTLAANRTALAEQGVLYSRAAGAQNHLKLALHATEGRGTGDLRAMAGLEDEADFAAFLRDFPAELRAEAEASDARLIFYSNEHLASRIRDADGVRRLWSLLGPIADEIKVLFYVRPQPELVLAGWSTMLKSGAAEPFDLARLLRHGTPLDHAAVLDRWSGYFAEPYWILRAYQRQAMAKGDIVADVLACCDIPAEAVPRRLAPMNRSLDAATAEFLRLYNAAAGPTAPGRGRLIQALEAMSDGPPMRLPPKMAEQVAAYFAEGNARLARRLLGREALFQPAPPEPGVLPALEAEDAVRIAARLWHLAHEMHTRS